MSFYKTLSKMTLRECARPPRHGWRRKLAPLLGSLLAAGAVLLLHRALLTAQRVHTQLQSYRVNRNLSAYSDLIQEPLIQPRSLDSLCSGFAPDGVVALVTSSPARAARRRIIRDTWASAVPTFFFLGLDGSKDELADIYYESKLHNDMVVFEFVDTYQNLTLKTAAMLQWGQRALRRWAERCDGARFVLKTDDDITVNPWRLRDVAREHANDALVGYIFEDAAVRRSPFNKNFIPRWLYPEDNYPEYLSGAGYLINEYLPEIVEASYKVPLINIEDVYFTYLVAVKALGLPLSHDDRLSPFQPVVPLACAYWDFASMHSMTPATIASAWAKIQTLGEASDSGLPVCETYRQNFRYFSSFYFLHT
ncbi:beta-1,3-galactosyltransferase 5 isoform X2 [Plutella xylostella]|uniref:beta-1,3-galactosyltransferase 5 isoform X2 n=1 Tax=Plutella xylostella TaxID=51655 RepID=UPI00203287C0|nr:beta-1,3-galactosyltransferase 5 isoform X2 [Plutella xylostella]